MFFSERLAYIHNLTPIEGLHKFAISTNENKMKNFKSVEEIITDLTSKEINPLSFTLEEEEKAKEFFTYTNYYSFSIYRKLLPRSKDRIHTFSECVTLYEFDFFLRENINKFTGVIELMFRATLVQELCKKYDGDLAKGELYLDKSIYNSSKNADEVLNAFYRRINGSKSEAVVYHRREKGNAIPFWVVVDEVTFGELFHFTTTLKSEFVSFWIDNAFDRQYRKQFLSWIKAASFMRNTCAHYSRVYGRYFAYSPPQYLNEDRKLAGMKKSDNQTLFANLLAIKNIIKFNSNFAIDDWNAFLKELSLKIKSSEAIITLYKMGFPENWMECLEIKSSLI